MKNRTNVAVTTFRSQQILPSHSSFVSTSTVSVDLRRTVLQKIQFRDSMSVNDLMSLVTIGRLFYESHQSLRSRKNYWIQRLTSTLSCFARERINLRGQKHLHHGNDHCQYLALINPSKQNCKACKSDASIQNVKADVYKKVYERRSPRQFWTW